MNSKLITTLSLLILFMSLPSGMHSNNSSDSENIAARTHRFAAGMAVVDLVLLERSPKQLKFQVRIKNTDERAILIVTDFSTH
jgi:hypothetical protein